MGGLSFSKWNRVNSAVLGSNVNFLTVLVQWGKLIVPKSVGNSFSSVVEPYWKSTEYKWIIACGAIDWPTAVYNLRFIYNQQQQVHRETAEGNSGLFIETPNQTSTV